MWRHKKKKIIYNKAAEDMQNEYRNQNLSYLICLTNKYSIMDPNYLKGLPKQKLLLYKLTY